MPHPSYSGNLVHVRLSILPETYNAMADVMVKYRISKGCSINLGPLLDLMAAKIDGIISGLPDEVKKRVSKKANRTWQLSADQIRLIRVSNDKQGAIAAEYRVDPATISRIKAGKAYAWVK